MARPGQTRVGRYDLVHRLAIGGMGEIFLARERGIAGFDRQVVVKVLIPELAEQHDLVTMFIDEARIAANLAHPNIVQIFEFGQDREGYYLAMEYVPGQNLAKICSRAVRDPRGLVTRHIAVHAIAEMARGLHYAHNAHDAEGRPLGIVHRDVSPHNLLLSIHGDVKVMDFGIAKASNTLHRTATGVIRGKYAYMSPEQLAGDELDVTTDVYSSGVMLWELTLMRRMWQGDELAVLQQVKAGKVPRPTEIDPTYPRDLEEIVMHAIDRDRTQRTPSAGALESDLRGWLALQGAVIDRVALGAVVSQLFPEVDHVAPTRGDDEPQTVSLTPPTASTIQHSPVVVESTPPQPRSRVRTALIAVASLAVAGTVVAVTAYRVGGSSSEPAVTSPPPPPPQEPAHVAQAPVPPPIDAGTLDAAVAAVAAGSGSATTHVATAHGHHREKPPAPPPAIAAVVAVAPPPAAGTLKIDAHPWGTISIPGHLKNQATPQTLPLPPGDYPVTVTISDTGRTVKATVNVASNATTKCVGTTEALTCDH